MIVTNIRIAIILLSFVFLSSTKGLGQANSALDISSTSLTDSLNHYLSKVNSQWGDGVTNLDDAINFLSYTTLAGERKYYEAASNYYLLSLRQADFQKDRQAIQEEVNRLIPLVTENTADTWQKYLKNEDKQLFAEMYGFWSLKDPYASTDMNERVVEHWKRIHYARKYYATADKKPYGTDDRGIYYVKMGEPERIMKDRIDVTSVPDPNTGELYTFNNGAGITSFLEVWVYNNGHQDLILLFGQQSGNGPYEHRENLYDLFDLDVQLDNNLGFTSISQNRDRAELIAQYGILEELSTFHPFFYDLYDRAKDHISGINNFAVDPFRNPELTLNPFLTSTQNSQYYNLSFIESISRYKFKQNLAAAPEEMSSLVTSANRLESDTRTYRFLDTENKNQLLFAVRTKPSRDRINSISSAFQSNKLFVYDSNWNQVDASDDLIKLEPYELNKLSLYTFSDVFYRHKNYFSSEVIDTSLSWYKYPGQINPQTSAIIASTGKQEIKKPQPLDPNRDLLVSDILIGEPQDPDPDKRIPIEPLLKHSFPTNESIMIFFEVYNIPVGGYSFTYYFEQRGGLFNRYKMLDDKPNVRIINDQTGKRDSELFSISLDDFEPGIYRLVLEFEGLAEEKRDITFNRTIELKVTHF